MTVLRRNNLLWRWLSLAPLLALLIVFTVVPVVGLVWMSFHDRQWQSGIGVWRFVGLDHWREFTSNLYYWPGLRNTVVFAVCAVSLQMVLGFFMALSVSRAQGWIRGALTTVFLLPVVVPPIVIGAMWKLLLGTEFGGVNAALGLLGVPAIDWLGNPALALPSIILVDVWHWTPFVFILLLAGIEALPQDALEAARLDTLSAWQSLRHIMLPLMAPTIAITLVFRIILTFKVFDEIYLLTSGGPGTATEVVSFSIQRTFFGRDDVGLGSVMSVFTLFVIALLAILAIAASRRRRSD